MLLYDTALPVEVILKVGDVRLALFRFEELLVDRDVHRRGWNLFNDTLLCADSGTIFELMQSENRSLAVVQVFCPGLL